MALLPFGSPPVPNASSTKAGKLSAADKLKLDTYPSNTTTAAVYPITVDANKTLTDGGSGPLLLSRSKTGHVDKCSVVIIIPAGQRTKLYLGADINPDGNMVVDTVTRQVTSGFNPAIQNWVAITCYGSSLRAALLPIAAPDNTPATIISATVDVNVDADKLVVIRTKPVDARDIASPAISMTGVSPTITSIVSVDGATATYDLSADFDGSEVGNLVVGSSRTDIDLNGNQVATQTIALAVRAGLVSQAAWTKVWEGGKQMLPVSPGNFSTWTDQVGGVTQMTPGSSAFAQTTTDPSVHFDGTANKYLKKTALQLTAGTDFGMFVRAKLTAFGIVVAFTDATGKRCWIQYTTTAVVADMYDGTLNPTPSDSFILGVGYHTTFLERTGTSITLTVDSRTPVSVSSAVVLSSLTVLSFGAGLTPSEYQPVTGDVRDFGYKSGAAFTGPEKTAILAYIAAHP